MLFRQTFLRVRMPAILPARYIVRSEGVGDHGTIATGGTVVGARLYRTASCRLSAVARLNGHDMKVSLNGCAIKSQLLLFSRPGSQNIQKLGSAL